MMTEAKPRVRYRDYRCKGCGRFLHRSNLDTIALAVPEDLRETHPLLYVALHSIVVDCRCPRCGRNDIATPDFRTNGNVLISQNVVELRKVE